MFINKISLFFHNKFYLLMKKYKFLKMMNFIKMGIGDWGLGIGDWGLGDRKSVV